MERMCYRLLLCKSRKRIGSWELLSRSFCLLSSICLVFLYIDQINLFRYLCVGISMCFGDIHVRLQSKVHVGEARDDWTLLPFHTPALLPVNIHDPIFDDLAFFLRFFFSSI